MGLRELLRKPFANTPFAERQDLSAKHAIVTGCGANSLGYETAKTLARWGASVVLTTRGNSAEVASAITAELAKEGYEANVIGRDLDLADAASVNAFAAWYQHHHGERLDILVNNAGVHLDLMSDWKQPKLLGGKDGSGEEIHWRINYLGTAHLTLQLLDVLKNTGQKVGEARVVNVVSQLHKRGSNEGLFASDAPYNSWVAYGLSKLASVHFSRELHRRYNAEYGLKAYSLHPGSAGGTSSDVAQKGLAGHGFILALLKLSSPLMKLMMCSPEEGAQTQIYCATAPGAQSGRYFQDCALREDKASEDSRDAKAAERLWAETERWLQGLGS